MSASDRQEIRELVDAYSAAVIRRNGAGIAACFAPDAIWQVIGAREIRHETAEGIGRGIIEAIESFDYNLQVNTAFVIEVRGDKASNECSFVEICHLTNGNGLVVSGVYRDELVRLDGQWRFHRRTCHLAYANEHPFNGVFQALALG